VSIFYMTTNRLFPTRKLILLSILFLASGCAPQPTSTPYRPPTDIPPTQILPTSTPVPSTSIPLPEVTSTPSGPCTNDLTFVDDATVPDGTSFQPGESIDKQWLVQNSGTCNWDNTYRLKWVSGDTLGAAEEQFLYPARSGTQATLRIIFTSPAEAGTYESDWQAVDPKGNPFGDYFSIVIEITP